MLHNQGEDLSPIRGDLIRWARTQQNLTMQEVLIRNGPSKAFQSEVERGIKREVRHSFLDFWAQIVNVTVPFVLGQVPRYHEDPNACRGLAADVRHQLRGPNWPAMGAPERLGELIKLVASRTHNFTPTVLAWVLSMEVSTLTAYIEGRLAIPQAVVVALQDLTLLPVTFFKYGVLPSEVASSTGKSYVDVIALAEQRGVPPEVVYAFILGWEPPTPTGSADRRG